MNRRILFRHMEHSDALQSHVDKQLEKIEAFFVHEPLPIYIDFTLDASKSRAHPRVELIIKTPHYDRVVHEEHNGTDMYEVIDRTVDRMYHLLREDKQRHVDDRRSRDKLETALEKKLK
jgi:ribosomal subunit interface protein